jgi:hypothetical protein
MASHHASSPVSMRRLPGAGAIFIEPKTSSRYWQALIATILALDTWTRQAHKIHKAEKVTK